MKFYQSGQEGIVVACGKGSLVLEIVQKPGGIKLSAAEFLAGHSLKPGELLYISKMIKTQILATYAVSKVLAGASLTVVLKEIWRTHHTLSDQQRGAIQDISYGVLRFYGQLDTLLGLLLKKPLRKQDCDVYC